MSESDKRKARRRYTKGVLEFYEEDGSLMIGLGRLLDLSITGALVESSLKLTVDQVLRLRLRLEGESLLELVAKVVRAKVNGSKGVYGIHFGNLSSSELSQIKQEI